MILSFSPFQLDLDDERFWKNGTELRLRRKPFAILKHLAEHPQRLVTHAEIVEAVWGKVAISEGLVRTHVHDLRQTLGDGVIETVVGRGYRFLPEVMRRDSAREPPAAVPPTSSIVGRTAELEVLQAALRDARGRSRRVAFIVGDAGMGKTTLLDAFLAQARAETRLWVARGTCVEQYGSGEAYLPILDALGALCSGRGSDRVVELLTKYAPTWLLQMPVLIPAKVAEDVQKRATSATHPRMLRELAEALEALSVDAPVVLALDDLQWSDPSTLDVVALLARRLQPSRLLLVGTYRPAGVTRGHPLARVAAELVAHEQAVEVSADAFNEDALRQYVAARYDGHRFPASLAASIHASTGGNPLFVTTLLGDLESRGMIQQVDGAWTLATSIEDVAARRPDSIRRLINTQIDRLAPGDQRIIEAASVVGLTFTAGTVAHVLDAPADEVDAVCETLVNEQHLLQYLGSEPWPDGTIQSRYAFAHALFRHAARSRNPSGSVRVWHRRVAERLESGHGGRIEEIASEIAVHYDEGRAFSKAMQLRTIAGERALARYGHAEALVHFRRAHEIFAMLPEGERDDGLELRMRLGFAHALFLSEAPRPEELSKEYGRAVVLATTRGDDGSLCRALVGRLRWVMREGNLRTATEHAAETQAVAERVSDPTLRVAALHAAAQIDAVLGNLSEAAAVLERVIATHTADARSVLTEPIVSSHGTLAMIAWVTGYPDRALRLAKEGEHLARTLGDPFAICNSQYILAQIHLWRGEPRAAEDCALTALRTADEEHVGLWQRRARILLERVRAELVPDLDVELPASSASGSDAPLTMLDLCAMAERDRRGSAQRALATLDRALASIEQTSERWLEPEFHRLRGEVLYATDAPEAERSFARAAALAREIGALSLELRAALSAHRYAAVTTRETGRDELRRLVEAFTEGHATGDLEAARAALGLEVP